MKSKNQNSSIQKETSHTHVYIYIYIYLLIEFNVIKLFFYKSYKAPCVYGIHQVRSFFGMQCVMCTPSTIGGCHSHWQA